MFRSGICTTQASDVRMRISLHIRVIVKHNAGLSC